MPPKKRDSIGNKDAKKSNKKEQEKVKKSAKDICLICKKKTDLEKDSIVCNVCTHQFHTHCKNMSEEQFDMLQDIAANGWENPWRCESCKSVLGALDDRINKNTAEIARVADKVEANEENISANAGKIKAMEEAMLKIQEKQDKTEKLNSATTSKLIQNELAQRQSRSNNLVFHGIPEAETLAEDQSKVQEVLDFLDVTGEITWVKRLGSWRKGKNASKPLLVQMKRASIREAILESANKLAKATNPNWKAIRIVPDMTPSQRDAEENLRKECIEKNLARSEEEIEKNLVYKLVGPKGAIQLRRFELRETEALHKGKVLSKEVLKKILSKDQEEEDMEVGEVPDTAVHSTPKKTRPKPNTAKPVSNVTEIVNKFNARRPSTSGAAAKTAIDTEGAGPSDERVKRKLGDLQYSPNGSPPQKEQHVENTTEIESENELSPSTQRGTEVTTKGGKSLL